MKGNCVFRTFNVGDTYGLMDLAMKKSGKISLCQRLARKEMQMKFFRFAEVFFFAKCFVDHIVE